MGGKRKIGGELAPPVAIDKSSWPVLFLELQNIHRSVCTFHTFLTSTRKNVIITFEILRSATQNELSRQLEKLDLAMIKVLISDDVLFEYVDENEVATDSGVQVGEGYSNSGDMYQSEADRSSNQLLIFDFIDGIVKPERKKAKIEGNTMIFKRTMKRPTYAVSDIKKMIEKRIKKFEIAINTFIKSNGQPVEILHKKSYGIIPNVTIYTDPVEDLSANSRELSQSPVEKERIEHFMQELKASSDYQSQIVPGGEIIIPGREANYKTLTVRLSEQVQISLKAIGIEKFYSHQVESLSALDEGKNIIVTTSTSSGKSLVYQLPVILALEKDPQLTALYIFPTKALAQDQKSSLQKLLFAISRLSHIKIDTYDGDTPQDQREDIRRHANVVFTNPDMIHCSILPGWKSWAPFLRNLKYIVVDELHMYSGLFGAHFALIMRRLRRICEHLGNFSFQIVCCSATIYQPESLMTIIFGLDKPPTVITEDGAPCGNKHVLVWNCPYLSPKDPNSGRVHPVSEAAAMMVKLVSRGIRTIAFCKVRRTCELMMKSVRSILSNKSICKEESTISSKIMSYRGGYSAQDRRKIEAEMFHGNLLGIVATNSLELGIDIGNLDAVLIVGFPYSVSNLRQQMGRAGRRNKDSLAVLLGSGDPVDQFYMNNPQEILNAPNNKIAIALDNKLILESHMQCAAYELAVNEKDDKYFGHDMQPLLQRLEVLEDLNQTKGIKDLNENSVFYTCHSKFLPWPADHVFIRGREEDEFAVVDVTNGRNEVIETVEASRTSFTLYEGGIFLHQGCQYLVKEFNPENKYAKIERVQVDWMTRQRDFHDVDPIEIESFQILESRKGTAFFGKIRNTLVVFGFFKFDKHNRIIDAVEVDNPPYIFESKGFWIDVPDVILKLLEEKQLSLAGAIHGAEHAILSLISNFVTATGGDVCTECKAPEKEFSKHISSRRRPARLIFYDNSGGCYGCGVTNKAYEFVNELIKQAADRVSTCLCNYGCPECIAAKDCKEHSEVISKAGALIILMFLCGRDIDFDSITQGPEINLKGKVINQTIIPATQVALSTKQLFK